VRPENERFVRALEIAFRPGSSDEAVREMFNAFIETFLLVPTITKLDTPSGALLTRDDDVMYPTNIGPDGARALHTFTDEDGVHRYSADAPFWIGLPATDLMQVALDLGYDELIVDPGPDRNFLRLDRRLLEQLAGGTLPV
jgi:hypothetical protein